MAGLLGYHKYNANFYDSKGNFIGHKSIQGGFKKGLRKSTFQAFEGVYNVKPEASRSDYVSSGLVDVHFFSYQLNNPDPLNISSTSKPLLESKTYRDMLQNKLIMDLSKVRNQGLLSFLTPQVLIILVLVIGAIIYFASGGTLTNAPTG